MTEPMLYAMRDADGRVLRIARGSAPDEPGWQPVAADDPTVREFLGAIETHANPLAETDANLARITEDLIEVLIDKGVLQFTDLPVAAQNKLLARRHTREQMAGRLQLLDDQELI
jgi:hypothetical protein